MSIKEKLMGLIGSFSTTGLRDKMEELGIRVISDERLMKRIEILAELHEDILKEAEGETPEEKLEKLIDKLEQADNILRKVAVPWGRGGDRKWFAEFMKHYEKLISLARVHLTCVRDLLRAREVEESEEVDRAPDAWRRVKPRTSVYRRLVDKSELVRLTENYLKQEIYPYLLFLIDVSFLEMDVLPSWTIAMRKPEEVPSAVVPTLRAPEGDKLWQAKQMQILEEMRRRIDEVERKVRR